MRILVVCQYYYPEPFRVSDICEELVKRGHEVDVVTGIPNYPMGVIYDGYRNGEHRDEEINGVHVHRCFTIGRRSGALWRFLNYYSFAFSSSRYVAKIKKDYDVVFVNQLSPVMMACAGVKYKKKHNKKLVLYCLDLWPESLVAGGIKKGSLIYNVFHKISRKLYKAADRILITSRQFEKYFYDEFEIGSNVTKYLPQYAEELFADVNVGRTADKKQFDFVFAGNIGAAQKVDVIIRAAAEMEKASTFSVNWHIVGDGAELDNCKKLVEELGVTSIVFHGRQPVERMPEYYGMADAMLVTLSDDEIISYTLPGKVQSYMAAGRPVIASANGETPLVIKEADCGYCCAAENFEALASVAEEFCELSYERKEELGKNARDYYNEHFSKKVFIGDLEKELLITQDS